MKKASKIFCIIGLVTNTLDAIWGITTKKRSVLLGVLLIIFENPLAGIFHLCSKDSEYTCSQ
jgi:gamma-glutamyl phosphate reductase